MIRIMNDTQSQITKDMKSPVWRKVFDAVNIAAYGKLTTEVDIYF
jgi:hypothetical protein